jgi:VIT1/CCC1 family predicted Fe2+/Mn2+ transporter
MDDFLGEILGIFLEVLLELIFEGLASSGARAVRRGSKRLHREHLKPEDWNQPALIAVSILLGVVAGVISIAILPAPIFHPGKVHGISLILSPVLTGLIMAGFGSVLRRRNGKPLPWESFWGGFAFALGMAVIRFLSAH